VSPRKPRTNLQVLVLVLEPQVLDNRSIKVVEHFSLVVINKRRHFYFRVHFLNTNSVFTIVRPVLYILRSAVASGVMMIIMMTGTYVCYIAGNSDGQIQIMI